MGVGRVKPISLTPRRRSGWSPNFEKGMKLFLRRPGVLGDRKVPRGPRNTALVFRQYFFRTEDSPARPTSVPARNSLDEAGGGDKDVIDRGAAQVRRATEDRRTAD